MLNSIEGKSNILLDMRAEKLFREAEDEFFYLNNLKNATEKIDMALEYSPGMIKAILMRANIAFIEGQIQDAFELYKRAEALAPTNIKVLAGLANVCEINEKNDEALFYIDKALAKNGVESNLLKKALIELKSSIFIKLGQYELAQKVIDNARYCLLASDLSELQANNLAIIKRKLELHKRLKNAKLKLVY